MAPTRTRSRKPRVEAAADAGECNGKCAGEVEGRPWVLYLLMCAGERLYAGITNDLAARYKTHREGRGARFTRAFPPLRIVAASTLPSRSAALKAEYTLKRQARSAKVRFLAGCGIPLEIDGID